MGSVFSGRKYRFKVDIKIGGTVFTDSVLAETVYHSRQLIYAKYCHIEGDISKYSMGRRVR